MLSEECCPHLQLLVIETFYEIVFYQIKHNIVSLTIKIPKLLLAFNLKDIPWLFCLFIFPQVIAT